MSTQRPPVLPRPPSPAPVGDPPAPAALGPRGGGDGSVLPGRNFSRSPLRHGRARVAQAAQMCGLDQQLQSHAGVDAGLRAGAGAAGGRTGLGSAGDPGAGVVRHHHAGGARHDLTLQRDDAARFGPVEPDGRVHRGAVAGPPGNRHPGAAPALRFARAGLVAAAGPLPRAGGHGPGRPDDSAARRAVGELSRHRGGTHRRPSRRRAAACGPGTSLACTPSRCCPSWARCCACPH